MSLPTQAFGVRRRRGNLFFAGKESRWSKFRIDGLKKGWETEPPNGSLRLKAVTEASTKYFMMRRDWNGIIVLKIERDLPKMALSILLLVLSIFLTNHSIAKERNPTMDILLIPVGEVDRKVIEVLQNELSKVFNKPVMIGKGIPEPDDAFSKKRNQYLSTAILNTIMEQKEYASYGKILGVVDHDLYVPELNFVFGEAGRRAAVISLTRLRQEFYNLPRDQDLFQKRVLTEAVHELGHTYGLGHCRNPRCVMFFSNTLVDTDRKGPDFCPDCKRQVESRK